MFSHFVFRRLLNNKNLLFLALVVLVAQRFIYLNGIILEPHMWRQADTFFYAFDFYKTGFDLLNPSVCWLGSYKTLILEFPLISAIMAVFFCVLGPEVIIAKIIAFVIFLLSSFFFYKIIKYLYYPRLAKFSVLVYMMLPLGLNYSISIHIDFGALLFTLIMIYFFLRGIKESKIIYIFFSSLFGIFAFIVKSPYAFYTYIPLIYFAYINRKNTYFWFSLISLTFPVLSFLLWQGYVVRVNSLAPDWFFIPDYFKFTNMASWYFGTLEQRILLDNWNKLFFRLLEFITGYLGLPLFVLGFFLRLKEGYKKTFFNVYSGGLLIYLLIFFNLNIIHDYYQIPFLVISSFFIAASIDHLYARYEKHSINKSLVISSVILILLMINYMWFAQNKFYKVDRVRKEVSEKLQEHTKTNDLIIASMKETDARDPRILAPAFRQGWAINISYLNKPLIDSLEKYGANYLVLTVNEELKDSLKMQLSSYSKTEFNLKEKNWKMYLYSLK